MRKKNKKFISLGLILASICSTTAFAAEDTCAHSNTEYFDSTESTCLSEGYDSGIWCDDCNSWISGHDEIPMLPHIDEDDDNVCDICDTKFTIKPYVEATCTENGYSGDEKNGTEVTIGEVIPAEGHTDVNLDFRCDKCNATITKDDITITLHYYIINEYYEKLEDYFNDERFTVKDSNTVPGCKYITETKIEKQNEEFKVPACPNIRNYKFIWTDKDGVAYKRFKFLNDTNLYMLCKTPGVLTEGQCGDTAYWKYFPEDERLRITGSGVLWNDYNYKAEIPWYRYLGDNLKVYMDTGIVAKYKLFKK